MTHSEEVGRSNSGHPGTSETSGLSRYGAIGNCDSLALIDDTGSVNWLCLPSFDSASVFARILDEERGGFFQVSQVGYSRSRQAYLPHTNILCTDFFHGSGARLRVTDFMPIREGSREGLSLVRILELQEGSDCGVEIRCYPRFDYARVEPQVHVLGNGSVLFESTSDSFILECSHLVAWEEAEGGVSGAVKINSGDIVVLAIADTNCETRACRSLMDQATELLSLSKEYWLSWVSKIPNLGQYDEVLKRSALTLKLLADRSSGGVIAAPTTSLPEEVGGVRNWDYRYVWLRDATFVVDAFYQVGHPEEGQKFVQWMLERALVGIKPLQIAYAINGSREAPEKILDHLRGHRDSRPVRVGNAAFDQVQLDVYGEVINCIDSCRFHGDQHAKELWREIVPLIEWVCNHWHEPDMGIWEIRAEPRHFVYSKAMAWVALDRAVSGAGALGGDTSAVSRWIKVRDEIRREVLERGWSEELGAFTQSYGSKALDAANLRLPLVGFISATDPKMKSTILATKRHLCVSDLVYRYRSVDDGVFGGESSFAICTFWLVQNLILLGELEEAERVLKNILSFGGALGLFSEEIGAFSGELLGNYPQSFTHVGIINSVVLLERVKQGLDLSSLGRRHFLPEGHLSRAPLKFESAL